MMKNSFIVLCLCITILSGCQTTQLEVMEVASQQVQSEVSETVDEVQGELEEEVSVDEVLPEDTGVVEDETEPEIAALPNTELFIFEYNEVPRNELLEFGMIESYNRFIDMFDIKDEGIITVCIYKDQASFWENTFGGDNNGWTTGFANHVERKISITTPDYTEIKSYEDMIKVPIHELVHILIQSGIIDIREGIAVYLADQLKPYSDIDIPSNIGSMITYQGGIESIRNSYNLAGWKAKFIIEECLSYDYQAYLNYKTYFENYSLLGYGSEDDFLIDLKTYLMNNATKKGDHD